MKKITLLFSVLLLCIITVNSQNNYITQNKKNSFNLSEERLKSNDDKSNKGLMDWIVGSTSVWQYTLINGGFFTLGSSQGVSDGIIDDECLLTFGHPFALSSFPSPVINGVEYSPQEYMANQSAVIEKNGGTLNYSVSIDDICKAEFSIQSSLLDKVTITYTLTNISDTEQNFGMKMLFDAANGKWDDGNIIYNHEFLTQYTEVTDNIQDSLVFWERQQSPKGMGYCIHFSSNKPDELIIGNWQNLYYENTIINDLFDLAVLKKWNEVAVAQGESISFSLELELLESDYNNQEPFVRWDMPSALSIENQILFPMEINTTVQIISGNQSYSNVNLFNPSINNTVTSTSADFNISSEDQITYSTHRVEFLEMYDSVVTPLTFSLKQGETIIDEIVQNIFIPASPFSDEGLIVDADSVFANEDEIVVRFFAKKEETGQYVYDLNKLNMFFWEEQEQITEFELSKDTTGGTNKADIIFVVDVSGSMGDNINQVRNNIVEFTDSLTMRGIDYRLGLVSYEYSVEAVQDLTNDPYLFMGYLDELSVHGGTENALAALMTAIDFDYRPDATRTIILLTDEPYEENNSICPYNRQYVIDAMLLEGITTHCISHEFLYEDWYQQITENTGGSFFDIYGNFRDILLAVARTDQNPKYLLSYIPSNPIINTTTYTVETHYAGLGGEDYITYDPNIKSEISTTFESSFIFPNPVSNNKAYINIDDKNAVTYSLEILDITGNRISTKQGDLKNGIIEIDISKQLSEKQLIVKVFVYDKFNKATVKTFKLITK